MLYIILTILSIPIVIVLSLVIGLFVFIPIALVFFPSTWVFSKKHTEEYGQVFGIKNKLIHHFLDYSYPNNKKYYWWGNKKYGDAEEIRKSDEEFEKEYGHFFKNPFNT